MRKKEKRKDAKEAVKKDMFVKVSSNSAKFELDTLTTFWKCLVALPTAKMVPFWPIGKCIRKGCM